MARVYTLPDFNLVWDLWVNPNAPNLGPADFVDLPGQLYVFSRTTAAGNEVQLRFPTGLGITIDLPTAFPATFNYVIEVPQGSGYFYQPIFTFWQHRGFPNEYCTAILTPSRDTGVRVAGYITS